MKSVRDIRKYEIPGRAIYDKTRDTYIGVRDSKMCEMPTIYKEVRDTRKCGVRKHKIPDTTKYQISRSIKYKEVRITKKYELPGHARYTRMDDIPGSLMKD